VNLGVGIQVGTPSQKSVPIFQSSGFFIRQTWIEALRIDMIRLHGKTVVDFAPSYRTKIHFHRNPNSIRAYSEDKRHIEPDGFAVWYSSETRRGFALDREEPNWKKMPHRNPSQFHICCIPI
jgi:hypothetical protein